MNNDELKIGDWCLVKDFEHGKRPVQIVKLDEDRKDYFWCRYSDSRSLYDFHQGELTPI